MPGHPRTLAGLAGLYGIEPYRAQRLFIHTPKPRALFLGGLGAGKTTAGAIRMHLACIRDPSAPKLVISQDYKQAREVTVRALLALDEEMHLRTGHRVLGRLNWQQKVISTSGAPIYIRSSVNTEDLRGFEVGYAWLDEQRMNHALADLCRAMQVSASGFRCWRSWNRNWRG